MLISAPVSFYFWLIRNKDRLDTIEEQRKDNNYTSFSHALTLLTDKDKVQIRALGLHLLIQIKNERGLFANEIDKVTQGIDLQGENLKDTNLDKAKLQGADLKGANLDKAKLQGADLKGANLASAKLQGANLVNANLEDTDLRSANLQNANLKSAILMDANLQNANLEGANLKGTDLRSSNFDMFTEHTTISSAKFLKSEIDKEKV